MLSKCKDLIVAIQKHQTEALMMFEGMIPGFTKDLVRKPEPEILG